MLHRSRTEVVGFEALMRWNHPERGWVPPSLFIPPAEMSTLVVELGSFALHEAVAAASSWEQLSGRSGPPYVTVNLSAHQFRDMSLVSMIEELLAQTQLESSRNDALLEIIISLGNRLGVTMLAEGIETQEQLDQLRQLGREFGQSYLVSPAVPADEATAMVGSFLGD